MDLIYGMVSMVKDIKQSDREFKNLNFQIKYTIQKGLLLLKKISVDDPNISFIVQNLNRRISEAESISKRLDELLDAQSIAIQDKIRLSLPFNQTKNQAIKIIESLEKAITDLKEEMPDEEKQENRNGGVKRKISQMAGVQQQQADKNILIERENNEIDQHIEQIYEMGPTINDDELHFSQTKSNKCSVEFNVEIKGQEEIVNILQQSFPDIIKTKKIFSSKDSQQISEVNLYTVARLNFQKCYNKLKVITKDIDRISTKGHFHFIIKRHRQNKPQPNENLEAPEGINRSHSRNNSSTKKKKQSQFLQVNNSKEQEEVFFSFPQDEKNQVFENLTVLMRKQDNKKVVYRFYMGEWQKIEEQQIEIGNGEKLAPFINPQTKQPSIYFQLSYGIING